MAEGSGMEENKEQLVEIDVPEKPPSLTVCTSLATECETCDKCVRYNSVDLDALGDAPWPNPTRLFFTDDPLCVMVRESTAGGHSYLMYKCGELLCMLGHMRAGLAANWMERRTAEYRRIIARQHGRNKRKRDKQKKGKKRKH